MGSCLVKLCELFRKEPREDVKYTRTELNDLRNLFKATYPNGFVAKSEFKNRYFENKNRTKGAELYLDNVFRAYDINNSKEIDFDEFITVLGIECRGTTEEKLHWMFSVFDTNRDGVISKTEMRCVVRALYKMGGKLERLKLTPDSHVKEIFGRHDVNKDEKLSLDEFLQIQNSEPELMMAMCANELNIGI